MSTPAMPSPTGAPGSPPIAVHQGCASADPALLLLCRHALRWA